jgi:N-acetylglutamate synthase-like GNAT family acetyltransferase
MKSGEVDDYKAIKEVLSRRFRHLSGSLKEELAAAKKEGMDVRKAKKSDQAAIEKTHEQTWNVPADADAYKEMIVAMDGDVMIGMARVQEASTSLALLRSLWVADDYRGGRLGQLLVRCILNPVKKGKVYLYCNPELENYYAHIGFRYVMEIPQALKDWLSKEKSRQPGPGESLFMMWEASQNKIDKSLTAKPDLIVIDGGKGQLNAALEAMRSWKLELPIIGLAKREEEIFIPGKSDPIPFPPDSPAKFLLMRLRDEAHRFSNRHRENRIKHASKESALDEIPGIGEETRMELLRKFGSLSSIRAASDKELLKILTTKQLEDIRKHLQ